MDVRPVCDHVFVQLVIAEYPSKGFTGEIPVTVRLLQVIVRIYMI